MVASTVGLALISLVGFSHAATPNQWAERSIYQVVTDRFAQPSGGNPNCNISNYCGGTWSGIVDKLDYIQGMGFTAIQISPIVENLPQDTMYGEAYHGYWPQNIYERNSHFGTDDDLKNLAARLHQRGMYLLVDVVSNEMAYDIGYANMTSSTHIDYSVFTPFNQSSDYEPFCPLDDWNNMTAVVQCWLGFEGVATPRIKTTDPAIQSTLHQWISSLVGTFDIDGIRIDGAKQIEKSFFPSFVKAAGVYSMAEVDDGDLAFACSYQNLTGGLENYPLFSPLVQAFTAGNMSGLVSRVEEVKTNCPSLQYLATFVENQDNPRFGSYTNDTALAANAIAFTILADGIPKIYYGEEQLLAGWDSPSNRQPLWPTNYNTSAPLYMLIRTLNALRNHAISLDSKYVTNTSRLLHTDGSTYATRKGPNGVQIVSVLSNQGSTGGAYTLNINGAASPYVNLTEVFTCETVAATGNGTIAVSMNKGQPRVFFPTFNLPGSGLCGTANDKSSGVPNTTTTASAASATRTSRSGSVGLHAQLSMGLIIGIMFVVTMLVL